MTISIAQAKENKEAVMLVGGPKSAIDVNRVESRRTK